MARVKRLALPPWWYLLAAISFGGAAYEAWAWHRAAELQAFLAQPETIRETDETPPLLLLAKATHLAQTGRAQAAIPLYHRLLEAGDPQIRESAHHNLATLYLDQGAKLWNAVGVLEYARVNTLVELAKENYREALRLNPENWDARYNLEYAWRVTPPPKEKSKSDFKGSKSSVYSTLPGLPGGGP
ncbi:bacterial transcriptional activator domain-containing protein [Methyloterricola oryzae]|uniref:bacterial transcriptional activator domain-containing protein n=1 Tax=Methyloterricola oryzae TaxID=1495050 RepID=UPI00069A03A5|nr:bacterial transcriptional activator domain-containing protein [Methyloterricola oryzae]